MADNSPEGAPVSGYRNNKVLIVDDNEQITGLLKEILEMKDYEVFIASTGQKALEIYQDNEIDTVISDLNLDAQTNGLDVIKEMKKMPPKGSTGEKNPSFIISSGYSNALDRETMNKIGIKGFLAKPFVFGDLFKLLES